METICVIGADSTIAKIFINKIGASKKLIKVGRSDKNEIKLVLGVELSPKDLEIIPSDCDKYLITLGLLYPKKINQQSEKEIMSSMVINLLFPVQLIEHLLDVNKNACIVLLGSESATKGSYDTSYFLAKAALAAYVREKQINYPTQQLVMVSPSVIWDSNMTQRRDDTDILEVKKVLLPKKRYLYAEEVVELIYFLLFSDKGYISNEVIGINGGKFARMQYSAKEKQ